MNNENAQPDYSQNSGPTQQTPRGEMPNFILFLIWSILEILSCCTPCGIVGIIFLFNAKSAYEQGDDATYEQKMHTAKVWLIVGLVAAVVACILYFILITAGVVAGVASQS